MHKNDWTFWNETVKFWQDMAAFYLDLGMTADMDRCISQADRAMMLQYEGRENEYGYSKNDFIVTGRKGFGVRPSLAVQVGC